MIKIVGCQINNYPRKKFNVEFRDDGVYANNRKYRDIHELVEFLKDCDKLHKNKNMYAIP